jgi:hypothetical protein
MTGEKNRYKSLEQKFNVGDKLLTTPMHDQMVIELLDRTTIYFTLLEFNFPMVNQIMERYGCVQTSKYISIKSEVPVSTYNGFIIGYWDIVANFIDEKNIYPIYIEVKPYIDSFGDTLRQLKTYMNFFNLDKMQEGPVCLYTPDDKFDKEFASQGIQVIHPLYCNKKTTLMDAYSFDEIYDPRTPPDFGL